MQVLFSKFLGLTLTCEQCGALLGYNDKDVYDHYIYCPICKHTNMVNYDKDYDGIVKGENNDTSKSDSE